MNEAELELIVKEEVAKLAFPSPQREPKWQVITIRGDTSVRVKIRDVNSQYSIFQSRTFVSFSYHPASNKITFENVCLRDNLRGKKAGRALVEMVENVAVKLGAYEIQLDSIQPEALEFWEHMGYAQDDDWEYRKHFRSS